MTSVLLRLRSEIRARWRGWLGLAVVGGLLGGASIAALAGARRTETAYPRFLEGTRAFDILVTNGGTSPENVNRALDFEEVRRRPEVADAVVLSYYVPYGKTPSGRSLGVTDITTMADGEGRFGAELNEARVLEGRLPRAVDEVAVAFDVADRFGVEVGDSLQLQLLGAEFLFTGPPAGSVGSAFRVVGRVAIQTGFPPLTGGIPPPVLLAPTFARDHPDGMEVFALRLHGGTAAIPAFERELTRLAGGEQLIFTDRSEQTSAVQRSVSVDATVLRLLAALVAAVGLLLVGQALARQAFLSSEDYGVLRALGMTPGELSALGVARALLTGLVAAAVAVMTAVALSSLTPVGVAREAELHPGVHIHGAAIGLGALAVLVAVSVLGAAPAWWSARLAGSGGARGPGRSPQVRGLLRGIGFSAPVLSGVRMALDRGTGWSAVPVRSAMVSAGLGVAMVAGVLSFSASLGRLFGDQRLYGWNWDVQVGDAFAPDLSGEARRLAGDPAVEATALGTIARLQIGPLSVDTLATEGVSGTIRPTVVDGRAPRGPNEILLGSRTLRELGRQVGDVVTVGAGEHTGRMRVVGRGVLTEFGGAARLGEGAFATLEGMRRLDPGAVTDVVLLRLRNGPEKDALVRNLRESPPGNIYLPSKPSDLADLERVGGLPSAVAGLLAVTAVATLAHTLVTSVRRRRRDLAVLKVLGFARGQVSVAVVCQASVIAVVALLLGLPTGIVGGRWAWRLFAERLGAPPVPASPWLATGLMIPGTVLLANLIAAVPARLAARTRPSVVLRAE